MDVKKENIENLTGLWLTVGKSANAYYSDTMMSYCKIRFSGWPNRLWFCKEVNEVNLKRAKDILLKSAVNLKISHWDFIQKAAGRMFKKHGFIKSSEQIGMALEFDKKYELVRLIRLHKVTNKENAGLWSELFQKAFNYQISDTLVSLTFSELNYFIATYENQPVGTCIMYHNSKDIIGIHSLGIIPEMRRKGFAEDMMKQILNQSMEEGFKHATLQASEMAKNMYEKLGFSTQFLMSNHQLKK